MPLVYARLQASMCMLMMFAMGTCEQEAISSASSLANFMKADLADGQRKLLAVIENAGVARTTKPINGGLPEKVIKLLGCWMMNA